MKKDSCIIILAISIIILFLFGTISVQTQEKESIASCCNTDDGRCTGSSYCSACKNCTGCKHCNSGGSCGVCRGKSKPQRKNSSRTYTPKSSTRSSSSARPKVNSLNRSNYNSSYYLSTLVVNTKELNLRSGPGTDYKIVEKLRYNQKLSFLAQSGNWIKVKVISSENIGWVYYSYVSLK